MQTKLAKCDILSVFPLASTNVGRRDIHLGKQWTWINLSISFLGTDYENWGQGCVMYPYRLYFWNVPVSCLSSDSENTLTLIAVCLVLVTHLGVTSGHYYHRCLPSILPNKNSNFIHSFFTFACILRMLLLSLQKWTSNNSL